MKDIFLLAHKLLLRKYYSRGNSYHHLFSAQQEVEALRALESLLQEQEVSNGKFPTFTHPKSTMFPHLSLSPSVEMFVRLSVDNLRDLLARHGHDNLTGVQRQRYGI